VAAEPVEPAHRAEAIAEPIAPPRPRGTQGIAILKSRRLRQSAAVLAALAAVGFMVGQLTADVMRSEDTGADVDVVVSPLRVRASPEFGYMGEVASEALAWSIGRNTLLRVRVPPLNEILNRGAPVPRTGADGKLAVTGTITQAGDSLVVHIVARSDAEIRSGEARIPAAHQDLAGVAERLIQRVLVEEVRQRTEPSPARP
jgi:hypothetical protein